MRGDDKNQSSLFHYFSIEKVVPDDHPIRRIRKFCDEALGRLSNVFDMMYSDLGRPSIAPEKLLKSQILIALYSVRSDEQFCQMLRYNLLFRWFLGMDMDEAVFDRSTFSKNRERLIENEVGQEFLRAVVEMAREGDLVSSEHFTVDGTLIEAWASMKSFQPKGKPSKRDKNDRNGDVDFKGEKRSNATHESTTDPDSQLYRKGLGKEAKLSFMGHSMIENRNGLILATKVTKATGTAEREAALQMLDQQEIEGGTLGADKGYCAHDFVEQLRDRSIEPHIAVPRKIGVLDKQTQRQESYKLSQRKRKLVEQPFGWMKTVGRMRKTTQRGIEKNDFLFSLHAALYNVVRFLKLVPATA